MWKLVLLPSGRLSIATQGDLHICTMMHNVIQRDKEIEELARQIVSVPLMIETLKTISNDSLESDGKFSMSNYGLHMMASNLLASIKEIEVPTRIGKPWKSVL